MEVAYPILTKQPLITSTQNSKLDSDWGEKVLHIGLAVIAGVPILSILAIVVVFIYETYCFLQQVPLWNFLTDTQWTPLFSSQKFGIIVLIVGTLLIACVAMIVAIPLGLLAAIYLAEYAPKNLRRVLKPSLEALAGVPTIVYGYFALFYLTPALQWSFDRIPYLPSVASFNALSAGIATGLLITPIIASLTEESISSVPRTLRSGAYALGFTCQEVIVKIVLPAAAPGILSSFTLAASRALGETMIAAIAAGQIPHLTLNPLEPVESITSFIVQVSLGDVPTNSLLYHTIFAAGMVLFLVTLTLNSVGQALLRLYTRLIRGAVSSSGTLLALQDPSLSDTSGIAGTNSLSLEQSEFNQPLQPRTFRSGFGLRLWLNRVFQMLTLLAALTGVVTLAVLFLTICRSGIPFLGWDFITSFPSRKAELAGILPALVGTLWIVVLTAILTIPLGVGAAIYLEEFVPEGRLKRWIEVNLTNSIAIPSVIYGLLGLALFVRILQPLTGGRTILSAALMMTLIVLPLMITSVQSVLRTVPLDLQKAAYAVGMNRCQVLRYVTLPAAFPGILTGILLALSRAIGETACLIAIGSIAFVSALPELSWQGLYSPVTTLTTQIFFWASRPGLFQSKAAATIIVLGILVLSFNVVAVLLRDYYRRFQQWQSYANL